MQNIRTSEGNSDWRGNARNGRVTKYAQTLLRSLCGLILCIPVASSAEVKTDAQWKYFLTDDGIEILMYRGNDTSVCVPDTIEGTKVYSIGANAFKQKNVASIKIPEGVSSIGRSAFEGCRQLKEVELPNTLEKIDRWAFWDCKSLQVIQLPPNIKDPKIEAFKGCDSLREVHICNKTLLNTPPTTSTTDIRKMLGVLAKVKIVQYDDNRLNAKQGVADDDPRYKKVGKYRVRKYADPEQVTGTETLELVLDRGKLGLPRELASTNIEVELGASIALPTEIVAHATKYLADKFAKGECDQLYDFGWWGRTYGNQDGKDMRFAASVAKNGETIQLKDKRNLKLTAFWKPREKAIIKMEFGEGTYVSEWFEAFVGVEIVLPTVTEKIEEARQRLIQGKSVEGWRCDYDFVNWSLDKGDRTYENGAKFTPLESRDVTFKAVWKPHVAYSIRRGALEQVEMNGHDTLVIPADVTEVSATLFGHRFESIRDKRIAGWKNLAAVEVSPENKNCFVKDGVLYYKRKVSPQRHDDQDAIQQEDGLVAARLIKECESIALPENVTSIGESAFEGCSNLANIDIPGAKSIGEYAFGSCVNLGCVKIGGNLTSIAENAFVGCPKLTNLVFSSDIDKIILDGLPNGIHITLPSSVRAFQVRSSDVERFSLTITTQDGAVTREVALSDLGKSQGGSGWAEWNWMRRQAELQTRSADKEKARLYPAYTICDSHPKLYREFCAGADRLWCVGKLNEMGSDNNKITLICDEKFGILTAVRVTFPSPGVSLEALLTKYKKQETGRFWVRGPKSDDELFYTGIIDKAKALFAESRGIVTGDDELMIGLILSDERWSENSKVWMMEVSSRKLNAALTELDRKEKAAMQEAREQAEKKAQKKLDSAALDF